MPDDLATVAARRACVQGAAAIRGEQERYVLAELRRLTRIEQAARAAYPLLRQLAPGARRTAGLATALGED